jgi:hypothetical protein
MSLLFEHNFKWGKKKTFVGLRDAQTFLFGPKKKNRKEILGLEGGWKGNSFKFKR